MRILISPAYGAGWSTWMDSREAAMFALNYQPLIDALTDGVDIGYDAAGGLDKRAIPGSPLDRFVKEYEQKFGHAPYVGGARDLEVAEVNELFRVNEYDGSETIETFDSSLYFNPDEFEDYSAEEFE
jgi:hypothetical protein